MTLAVLLVDKCTLYNKVLFPTHNEITGLTEVVKNKETGAEHKPACGFCFTCYLQFASCAHRWRIQILWILTIFKIHEFYWILTVPTEFSFKIQYFNVDCKITITILHSHRNTQQWKVRLKSVLFRVKISNSPLFPFNSMQFHSDGHKLTKNS